MTTAIIVEHSSGMICDLVHTENNDAVNLIKARFKNIRDTFFLDRNLIRAEMYSRFKDECVDNEEIFIAMTLEELIKEGILINPQIDDFEIASFKGD